MADVATALNTDFPPIPRPRPDPRIAAAAPATPPAANFDLGAAGTGLLKADQGVADASSALAAAEGKAGEAQAGLQAEQGRYIEGLHNREEQELRGLDQGPFQPKQDTLAEMGSMFMLIGMAGAFLGSKGGAGAAANAQAALSGVIDGWNKGDAQEVQRQKAIFDENAAYLKDKADKIREIYKDYEQDALKVGVPTAQGRLEQRLLTEAQADVNAQTVRLKGAQAGQKQAEDIWKIAETTASKNAELNERYFAANQAHLDRQAALAAKDAPDKQLSQDAVHFQAEHYLITGQLPATGMSGAGKIAILNEAAQMAKDSGMTGRDLAAVAGGYASNKTALAFLTRQASVMKAFEDTMLKNMVVAQKIGKDDIANSMPWINRWVQSGETQFGNERVPAYATSLLAVMDPYAKILSGATGAAGSTDAARAQAAGVVSQYLTTGQTAKIFDVIRQDAANRTSSYEDERQELLSQMRGGGDVSHETSGGPKEGDTRASASGKPMVFKDGRWQYQ